MSYLYLCVAGEEACLLRLSLTSLFTGGCLESSNDYITRWGSMNSYHLLLFSLDWSLCWFFILRLRFLSDCLEVSLVNFFTVYFLPLAQWMSMMVPEMTDRIFAQSLHCCNSGQIICPHLLKVSWARTECLSWPKITTIIM